MPLPHIRVYVVSYQGKRRGLQLRWNDHDGRVRTRATDSTRRREAERLAADFEKELNSSNFQSENGEMTFARWKELIDQHYCGGAAKSTVRQISSQLAVFSRHVNPECLEDVNTASLTLHVARMRSVGRSENTIRSHLRTFRALLRWSVDQGYIPEMPRLPKIPRTVNSQPHRGRPLTDEEFDLFLAAVGRVVEPGTGDSWRRFLRGLWLSGLRLAEALRLTWDVDGLVVVDLESSDRGRLVFRTRGQSRGQKSGKDQLTPITPDFRDFLAETPVAERSGPVFAPGVRYGRRTSSSSQASHVISDIGESAAIKTDPGRFATAHDLRRSFGLRWAKLVMPAVLQQLMRHASIMTTLQYYVQADADRWSEEVYKAWDRDKLNQQKTNGSKPKRKPRRKPK